MKILAIDLGKNKSVACIHQGDAASAQFYKVSTTPSDLHELILQTQPERVVIEVCSAAGWVADLIQASGTELKVANTAARA